ncbi:translation elongation factor Ts [Haploplasma axanthum]|uniref:Elongation factor Ts n=1 Tax=Haploplasma axanthum TaxID=29552 RepID=A0A449BCT2_HAPAX|nr:translation elongation factor Ts [Haploplasma axanthum]VEU80254.1 Elongation factor Ts [Haploplasma axanthum]
MGQISAQLVKELREKTGAGMMDCKKALMETNGDIQSAIDYLRERGIAQAAKKSGRVAAEGLCEVVVDGNNAVIFELNSETDFVAKNKDFLELLDKVGKALINSNVTNTEEALALTVNGETVETFLINATAKIGEKITLRRVTKVTKDASQGFGAYSHMGGRIVSLVLLAKDNEVVGKDIAMHIAANNPRYLNSASVDAATLEHEKQVLTNQALQEGKPANIVEKMIVGRLNKYLKEICLVDQPFVKDPDLTVAQYLKNNGNDVISFVRLEVGEGIEKVEEDFAAEVAAVTKGN